MSRRSKLGVLVRLARLEESRRLRTFAAARKRLQDVDTRRQATDRALATSGHTYWMNRELASTPAALQQSDRHQSSLRAQLAHLAHDRREAALGVQRAQKELAAARLRTRALEKTEARRLAEARAERTRREERRLEDTNRRPIPEVRHDSN